MLTYVCKDIRLQDWQKVKIRNMMWKKSSGLFQVLEVIKLISYFLPLIASTAVFGSAESVNSIGLTVLASKYASCSTSMVSTPESGDVLRVISSIPVNEKLDSNVDPEMFYKNICFTRQVYFLKTFPHYTDICFFIY